MWADSAVVAALQHGLSLAAIVGLCLTLWRWNCYILADALVQVACFELNRVANARRRRSGESLQAEKCQADQDANSDERLLHVACAITYRESAETLRELSSAYCRPGGSDHCRAFVLCIDGDDAEDYQTMDHFQAQPDARELLLVNFDKPLCHEYENLLIQCQHEEAADPATSAFERLYLSVRRRLEREQALQSRSTAEPALPVCVMQPHVGRRGTRFTALLVSLVLADLFGAHFVWSTDSDTLPDDGTVTRLLKTLAGDEKAGCAVISFAAKNDRASVATAMAKAYFQLCFHVPRSVSGVSGESTAGAGCGTGIRTAALRSMLAPWISQKILGYRTEANEDANIPAQVGMKGWARLYVPEAVVATHCETSLLAWLEQLVRWRQSGIIENASAIGRATRREGVLVKWWRLRKLLVRPIMFAELVCLCAAGRSFGRASMLPLVIIEAVTAIYNSTYTFKQLPHVGICLLSWLAYQTYAPLIFFIALSTMIDSLKPPLPTDGANTSARGSLYLVRGVYLVWPVIVGVALFRLFF